jgi:hypothetical protein
MDGALAARSAETLGEPGRGRADRRDGCRMPWRGLRPRWPSGTGASTSSWPRQGSRGRTGASSTTRWTSSTGSSRSTSRRLPLLPRDPAVHGAAGLRARGQHRLGRGQGGQPERRCLFGLEGRGHGADEVAGKGTCGHRHRGQLRHARRRPHPHLRPDEPAHIDFMLSKIPRGRFLEVDEAANMIAWLCTEGELLHHRRGLRPVGRARDLLGIATEPSTS